MGQYFTAAIESTLEGVVTLMIRPGEIAGTNAVLVPDALAALATLPLAGGRGIRFNGPATLPVAMALAHAVSHRYGYVACFDPKLQAYVVAISHDPEFRPGQLLPVGSG